VAKVVVGEDHFDRGPHLEDLGAGMPHSSGDLTMSAALGEARGASLTAGRTVFDPVDDVGPFCAFEDVRTRARTPFCSGPSNAGGFTHADWLSILQQFRTLVANKLRRKNFLPRR